MKDHTYKRNCHVDNILAMCEADFFFPDEVSLPHWGYAAFLYGNGSLAMIEDFYDANPKLDGCHMKVTLPFKDLSKWL